jgi:uncharacterized membrane protein YuzA (DUF378 family)
MYWMIVGIIGVFLLLLMMPVSKDEQDSGKTNVRTVIGTSLVLLLLGALGTVIGMLVGP